LLNGSAVELGENALVWRNFRTLGCNQWHVQTEGTSMVLMGDAARTAHFSIGSGTLLALDDAIELTHCLQQGQALPDSLTSYGQIRRVASEKLQRRANQSAAWFETMDEVASLSTSEISAALLARAKSGKKEDLLPSMEPPATGKSPAVLLALCGTSSKWTWHMAVSAMKANASWHLLLIASGSSAQVPKDIFLGQGITAQDLPKYMMRVHVVPDGNPSLLRKYAAWLRSVYQFDDIEMIAETGSELADVDTLDRARQSLQLSAQVGASGFSHVRLNTSEQTDSDLTICKTEILVSARFGEHKKYRLIRYRDLGANGDSFSVEANRNDSNTALDKFLAMLSRGALLGTAARSGAVEGSLSGIVRVGNITNH